MYRYHMLHLDGLVSYGILYNACSDYDNDDIFPSISINNINYEQIRFVDVKLYDGCFNNRDYVKILRKCLTSNFSRTDTSIEWMRYREYRTIHVNNIRPIYHIFESEEYKIFKEILNEKDILTDRIILEIHSNYPLKVPGTSSENLEVKIPDSFEVLGEVLSFPAFPVIEFVINDKNKTTKEILKKTFVNKRYLRESIIHYDTKS